MELNYTRTEVIRLLLISMAFAVDVWCMKTRNELDSLRRRIKTAKIEEGIIEIKDTQKLRDLCKNRPTLKSCNCTNADQVQIQDTCGLLREVKFDNIDSTQDDAKNSRKKRTTNSNPCTSGLEHEMVLLYVVDEDWNIVEVWHDPQHGYFQTFYITKCDIPPQDIPSGYSCNDYYWKMKTRIWDLHSNVPVVANILFPGFCGLMKD